MKLNFSGYILEKYPNMKFYEQFVHWEPSCSLLTDWRTDKKIVTVAFQNSAKAPKAGTYSTRKGIRLLWRVMLHDQGTFESFKAVNTDITILAAIWRRSVWQICVVLSGEPVAVSSVSLHVRKDQNQVLYLIYKLS
jgi:hypothetical protein